MASCSLEFSLILHMLSLHKPPQSSLYALSYTPPFASPRLSSTFPLSLLFNVLLKSVFDFFRFSYLLHPKGLFTLFFFILPSLCFPRYPHCNGLPYFILINSPSVVYIFPPTPYFVSRPKGRGSGREK